jgi:hypothetical protein
MKYYYILKDWILGKFEYHSCEECDCYKQNVYQNICDECLEENYCECGQRLEDSWGSSGDGFCIRCR